MSISESNKIENSFINYNKICIKGDMILPFIGDYGMKSVYFDNNDIYLGIAIRKMPDNELFFYNSINPSNSEIPINMNVVYKRIDMQPVTSSEELSDREIYFNRRGDYIGNKSQIIEDMPEYKLINKTTFIGGFYSYTVSDKKNALQFNYPTDITALVLQRAIGNPADFDESNTLCKDNNIIYAQFKIANGSYLPEDEEAIKDFINNNTKHYLLDGKKLFTMNEKTEYTGYRE